MKISIIIPTLKEEKALPRLLDDLSKQTDPNFEVIVSDGNSDDRTQEIALNFSKKIKDLKLVVSKKRGVSHQRNEGGKKASGEWLIFLDADDRLGKNVVEKVKYQIKKKDPDVFTCWCDVDSRRTVDKSLAMFINIGTELGKSAKQPMVMGSFIGVKKSVFDIVGGFNEDVSFGEDSDFVQDCVKKDFAFKVFRKPRYVYSLRRVRKMGRMSFLRKAAVLNFKRLFNTKISEDEYPMGGLIENLKEEDVLKTINEKLTSYVKRNVLLKKLQKRYQRFKRILG